MLFFRFQDAKKSILTKEHVQKWPVSFRPRCCFHTKTNDKSIILCFINLKYCKCVGNMYIWRSWVEVDSIWNDIEYCKCVEKMYIWRLWVDIDSILHIIKYCKSIGKVCIWRSWLDSNSIWHIIKYCKCIGKVCIWCLCIYIH